MTAALWCVLTAAFLPYVGTVLAKAGGHMPASANRDPRSWLATLEGWPKRAHAFQLNSFEAFAPFAVAVLVAQTLHAPQGRVDALALAFIGLRVAYLICYLTDRATLRSWLWLGGLACTVALFLAGV